MILGDDHGIIYPVIQWRRRSLRCALGHHDMRDETAHINGRMAVVLRRRCRRCYGRDWAYEDSPEGRRARDIHRKSWSAPYGREV